MNQRPLDRWTPDKSAELYGVRYWGGGYFAISDSGEVVVCPRPKARESAVSLMDIVSGLSARDINMPVLVRFSDILASRIQQIHASFAKAIAEFNYRGTYRGVYPIKVNQQEHVVEEVTRYGRRFHHGLEAGSKAELIAAISFLEDPEALLVCNGYKDAEFIDLALYGAKMGLQCVLVVESMDEIALILERAEALGVEPMLGIRVKLSSQVGGHWTESGGDRSVFGLTTAQVVDAVDFLRARDKLNCLQLLHYHLGSQIPNIRDVRAGVVEACRVYAGLVEEGAPMGYLDLGGGLAVDYDGSHTNFRNSSNYSVDEYCADIIEVVSGTLDDRIQHPTIVTESGRATVAYYSVLLFNVLNVGRMDPGELPGAIPDGANDYIANLWELRTVVTAKNAQECYHDAVFYRDELRQLFKHGSISLRERALGEKIFWHVIMQVAKLVKKQKYVPDEFKGLDAALSDIYYGNFSIFQSLPDSWAIDQSFPIMPIHRLDERPIRHAIISDITCDCDGKIDKFVDLHDIDPTLPLHPLVPGEEYYLGVFLVGAYQETLGDLHNLLGDTNVISVRIGDDGEIEYEREIEGDSVADVLSYVEYDTKSILVRLRTKAEQAVRAKRISLDERRTIVSEFTSGLQGYTYFEQ